MKKIILFCLLAATVLGCHRQVLNHNDRKELELDYNYVMSSVFKNGRLDKEASFSDKIEGRVLFTRDSVIFEIINPNTNQIDVTAWSIEKVIYNSKKMSYDYILDDGSEVHFNEKDIVTDGCHLNHCGISAISGFNEYTYYHIGHKE